MINNAVALALITISPFLQLSLTDFNRNLDTVSQKTVTQEKARLKKSIEISLKEQTLKYYFGPYLIKEFKISSGKRKFPTPTGQFQIVKKLPVHRYKGLNEDGSTYDFPNTQWNMLFRPASNGENLYIHGAYWHNKFGTPVSHGCINVSYQDMPALYDWADIGTKVIIY